MKTLIVEDDFTSRLLLQELLKGYGPAHVAVNGKEAVEAARMAMDAGEPYDLICLDIMMPEMDGHGALKEIRAQEEARGSCLVGRREDRDGDGVRRPTKRKRRVSWPVRRVPHQADPGDQTVRGTEKAGTGPGRGSARSKQRDLRLDSCRAPWPADAPPASARDKALKTLDRRGTVCPSAIV